MRFFVLALGFSSFIGACTVGDDDPPGLFDGGIPPLGDSGAPPAGPLRIEPADQTRTIEGAAVVIDYRAIFTSDTGVERDVTAEVAWTHTTPALGAMVGPQFTSVTDRGGFTQIRATMGPMVATTGLTLRLARTIITPGTPPDAPTRFGGVVDPSASPEIVYPTDGTMVPPNIGELEFHYRTNGSTLFELHVAASAVDLRVYFGCPEAAGGGCIYTPDREVWEILSTAAAGTGPFTYTLRGVDDAGRLGEATSTLIVAEEPITGGLYYWNAIGGAIERFEFGVRGARAERFLDGPRVGALMCIGCHALSRDGRRIAVGTDIPTTTLQVYDVATRTRVFGLGMGSGPFGFPSQPNFYSFNPDATQLAASSLTGINILDGTTGAVVAGPFGGGAASQPDFSPDGQHIAFVRHESPPVPIVTDVPGVTSGRIVRLDWDGSTWVVGPELVAGGGNNFYPAYTPDGSWVVFNRSPSNANSFGESGMGGGVRDAEMWVVSSNGGPPIRLEMAGGLTDSWPKFDPTSYLDRGTPVFWFAWSSRRAFGLRYGADTTVQLWMSAFDPMRATAGADPALPAFRLPFQDLATGNHIAQWVTSIERMTCDDDGDCGGEFCIEGRCYEEAPLE